MAATKEASNKRELPRGFFRSEVIKNRHDPEIANRGKDDAEDA